MALRGAPAPPSLLAPRQVWRCVMSRRWLALASVLLLVQVACAQPLLLASGPSEQAPPAPTLRLSVEPQKSEVLREVTLSAEGLPPNRTVVLTWGTVEGGWQIAEYYKFLGKRFAE